MCQVRRHNHADSAWIVAHNHVIYDVTDYLKAHPGGADCILRKAGGVQDCAVDLAFHSKRGRKAWENYRVGTVRQCGEPRDAIRKSLSLSPSHPCHWWNAFWAGP